MREIRFRGINPHSNQWIYGYYQFSQHTEEHYVFPDQGITEESDFWVKKETIGQFTGLKDKNGKDIYEGDILRIPAQSQWEEKNFLSFEVFWHDNDACDRHVGWQMNRTHSNGVVAGGFAGHAFKPSVVSRFEVIGNIHTDPNLLDQ